MPRRHAANFEMAVLIGGRSLVLIGFLMRTGVRDQNDHRSRRGKFVLVGDSASDRAGIAAVHDIDGGGASAGTDLNSLLEEVNAIGFGGFDITFLAF